MFPCIIAFSYSKSINTVCIIEHIPSTHHCLLWMLNEICTQVLKYLYIELHIHQYIH